MNIRTGLATGLFFAFTAVLATTPGNAAAENMNPELLGGSCVVCHGPGGKSQGHIPEINDKSADKLASIMREFRDGKRPATVMTKIAKGYTDGQIDVIANHFGTK